MKESESPLILASVANKLSLVQVDQKHERWTVLTYTLPYPSQDLKLPQGSVKVTDP